MKSVLQVSEGKRGSGESGRKGGLMWRLNRGTGGAPIKSMDSPSGISFAAKKLQKMLFCRSRDTWDTREMFYSYRLLFMNRNHSLDYDPVASFGDCLPRFKSKRGKENTKGPKKKLVFCAEKETWMKVDSGRALNRLDIAESRLEERGMGRERGSSGRAETS